MRFEPEDYSGINIKEAFTMMPELKRRWMNGEITTLEVRVVYKAIKKVFLKQMEENGENDK